MNVNDNIDEKLKKIEEFNGNLKEFLVVLEVNFLDLALDTWNTRDLKGSDNGRLIDVHPQC